jgi:hypothetical protein
VAPLAKNGGPQKKSWTAVAIVALFVVGFLAAGAFGSVADTGGTSSGSTDTSTLSSPPATDTAPAPTSTHTTSAAGADTTTAAATDTAATTSSTTTTSGSSSTFSPSISTDQFDYNPGATVTLTGTHWGPGEAVHLFVNDTIGQTWSYSTDVTADALGSFVNQFALPTSFISSYTATATASSGATATSTFTDGNVNVKTAGVGSASVDWKLFGNTTCSGTATNSGTISATSAGNGAAIPGGAGTGQSLRLTAGTVTGATFSSWSNGNFTTGAPSTANPVCLVGAGNTQNIVLTYAGVAATTLGVSAASGTYGGTATLSATLTSGGAGVSGKSIGFSLNGNSVGTATTDASGVATLNNVSLTGIAAGTYSPPGSGVDASFAGDSSFGASSGTAGLTVNQASSTTTVTCPASVTYDGTAQTPCTAAVTGAGGLSQSLSVNHSNNTNAGTATASASYGGDANHTSSSDSRNFTINPASSTTTVTCSTTVTYNGSTQTPCSATATGVGGLNQSLVVGYSNNTNAGTAAASASFGGDANHTSSSDSRNFTVNPRAITVTAEAKTKVYGNADPALTYQVTSGSLAGGDTFSGTLSRAPGDNVGSHNITQGSLTLGSNYLLSFVGATLTITPRPVSVSTDAKTKVYGDGDPALTYQLTSGSLVSGDSFSGALARDPGENVGSYNITQGTLALSSNYSLAFAGASLSITPRAVTIAADPKSKAYGNADPALTYHVTAGSLVPGDAFSGALARDPGENVGSYTITRGTLALSGNYNLTFSGATLTISTRQVTITADAQNKVYGNADPALTYQVTSGSLAFSDLPSGTLARDPGESAGSYTITRGTLSLGTNYNVAFVGSQLTITPRPVTVTADPQSKIYGDPDPALTYHVTSGSVLATDTFGGSLSRDAGEGIGSYNVTLGTLSLGTSYDLTFVGSQLTVSPRPVSVTADSGQQKMYGDSDPALSYHVTSGSLVSGDAFTGALSRDAGENVGSYAINQGTLSLSGNYTLHFEGAAFAIERRPVTVTADSGQQKTYGDPDPVLAYHVTSGSLAFSDVFSGSLSRDAGENVGSYAIHQGSLTLGSNYELSFVGDSFAITKRSVTVTADSGQHKTYGAADPVLSYHVSSGTVVNGDGFSGALARDAGENVGSYAINLGSLTLGGNYELSFVGDDFAIAKRPVTVTSDAGQGKVYGDPDPALTYHVTSGSVVVGDSFSGGLSRVDGENVGAYEIKIGSLTLGGNYEVSFVGASFAVAPRPVSVTADSGQHKTYGDADPVFAYHISSGSLAFNDSFVGALSRDPGEDVRSYNIGQGSIALSGNYLLSFVGATFTIDKRPVTVTADSGQRKTYGDPDPAFAYHISHGSLAFSDAFTGSLSRAAGENVGDHAITQGSLTLGGNYDLSFVGSTFVIGPRPVTVLADAGQHKTYGESDPALAFHITSGALVSGDAFSGALSRDPGESVGTHAIRQGSLSLGGNYDLTFVGDRFTITKRPVTVTADPQSKMYGEADPALTYRITSGSLVFGDYFTGTLERDSGENVGGYAITNGSLGLGGNYDLTYVGSRLTITTRPVTVTADPQSRVYGDADPALTYHITSGSLVNGDGFSGGPDRAAGEDVGSYNIAQGSLALSDNYLLSFVGSTLTISRRPVMVTADLQSKVYGDADPTLTYQITSGSLAFSDAFMGALTRDAGESVGTYAVREGTLALSSNYTLTYVGAGLKITARPVTVTADPQSKVYGYGDPALTYKLTSGSLVGGDGFSGSLGRSAGENVGHYDITLGTLSAGGNYDLTFVGAKLTVTPRPLTTTADPQTKVYGDADPMLTYKVTAGSLASGDSFAGSLTRDGGENVGSYGITQGTLSAGDNYNLTFVGAKLTVTPRPITVTADPQTKVYGYADPTPTYKVTSGSLVSGDDFAGKLARSGGENVGSYAITQGTLALSGNYTLSYVGASLTITPRPVTVTADAKSKVYGDPDPALTYQVTSGSLVAGDGFTGELGRAAGEGVGSYNLAQGSLALNSNYLLSFVGATFVITPRPITVTADPKTKVYLAPDPQLTYKVTSGSPAFSDSFTGTITRDPGEAVGSYAIKQGTLALNGNYQLTFVGAYLTIAYAATCNGAPLSNPILQPVNSDGTSAFKQGSTIPLKFQVCNASGNSVGPTTAVPNVVQSFVLTGTSNGSPGLNETVVSTTPDTAFRWDSTSQQWIFNLSTKNLSSNKTYTYTATLVGGATFTIVFGLR